MVQKAWRLRFKRTYSACACSAVSNPPTRIDLPSGFVRPERGSIVLMGQALKQWFLCLANECRAEPDTQVCESRWPRSFSNRRAASRQWTDEGQHPGECDSPCPGVHPRVWRSGDADRSFPTGAVAGTGVRFLDSWPTLYGCGLSKATLEVNRLRHRCAMETLSQRLARRRREVIQIRAQAARRTVVFLHGCAIFFLISNRIRLII